MKRTIPVVGMACTACAANVERKLKYLPGISSAAVSLAGRNVIVDYDPATISLEKMKSEINNIGYDLVIETNRSVEEIRRREFVLLRRKTIVSWVVAILVMSLSMGWLNVGDRNIANQLSLLLSLLCIFYCGKRFYISGIRQLLGGASGMDTLIVLSTGISFLLSVFNTYFGDAYWGMRGIEWHTYYDAVVMIITFVLTGRLLEEKAKDGMATSISRLMGMAPKTARIVSSAQTDGQETIVEVPIATIKQGDILAVKAGERVSVDSVVTRANSFMTADAAYVDESMITGEPLPVEKKTGSQVLAGTIVSQGEMRIRALQVGDKTALANIINMVQQAQSSKAPVQRIVDRAARVFVPVVIAISAITFMLWWFIGGDAHLPQAILSAVAVLVVACPCAMGLATPTALMVGIGKAAERHIYIKDATALETLCKVDALVCDKTGTLTIANNQVDFTKDNVELEQREQLKPNAREAIADLQAGGVEVYMVSGDKQEAVEYWAEKTGVNHFLSNVLPQDKEDLVKRLQREGKKVGMIGDGINDTQGLANADVSIAIGKGSDIAMDVAQVTLMTDDLEAIPEAVTLSRKTVKMVWQNLFWAFIYNIVCIPLAAGLLHLFGINFQITPMWASALMAFSSLSVVLNSLRLKLSD